MGATSEDPLLSSVDLTFFNLLSATTSGTIARIGTALQNASPVGSF